MLININSLSVSAANRLNIIFVICKVTTMLIVIIVGLVRIGQGLFFYEMKIKYLSLIVGHTQNLQNGFVGRIEW
jgi:L-asparagine transporter-like permease